MGWFGSASKVSPVTEVEAPQLLEDLPPKFEDRAPPQRPATYGEAVKEIKFSDFSVAHFVEMPCFREAMLTGFQAMGVLGVVTFLIHKNPGKSVNWAVGGFFLGNVVGFEQCRLIRRRLFQTVEAAKQANMAKVQLKLSAEDENQKKWDDVQRNR